MNEVRPNPGGTRSAASAMRHGTVLMECVLVLPLLTLLIFAIVQFALIWYAQIMTHYAAYNAARAALVYNPAEYSTGGSFKVSEGPCWQAACQTLAWVSSSPDWNSSTLGEKGAYRLSVPGWFSIPYSDHIAQQVRIVSGECEEGVSGLPAIKMTVAFDYPLHVPVISTLIAEFDGSDAKHPTMQTDFVTLKSTVLLPKPWSTSRYARLKQ